MLVKVPLSAQQEAHVALILEVYASATADIDRLAQQALTLRNQRLDPLRTELGVPNGVTFSVQVRVNGDPAYVTYEGPDDLPNEEAGALPPPTRWLDKEISAFLQYHIPGAQWAWVSGRDAIRLDLKTAQAHPVTTALLPSVVDLNAIYDALKPAVQYLAAFLLSPRDPPAPDALSRSVESTSADAPES